MAVTMEKSIRTEQHLQIQQPRVMVTEKTAMTVNPSDLGLPMESMC